MVKLQCLTKCHLLRLVRWFNKFATVRVALLHVPELYDLGPRSPSMIDVRTKGISQYSLLVKLVLFKNYKIYDKNKAKN